MWKFNTYTDKQDFSTNKNQKKVLMMSKENIYNIPNLLSFYRLVTFHLQTKFGAKLDSLADNGTFFAAVLGVFTFKYEALSNDIWMLWLFIGFFISGLLISILKFKQFPSLHLYTTKIGGYLQGFFLFVLFAWSYNQNLFYAAMIMGYISHIEEISILFYINEMKSDAKGLYWILKEKNI